MSDPVNPINLHADAPPKAAPDTPAAEAVPASPERTGYEPQAHVQYPCMGCGRVYSYLRGPLDCERLGHNHARVDYHRQRALKKTLVGSEIRSAGDADTPVSLSRGALERQLRATAARLQPGQHVSPMLVMPEGVTVDDILAIAAVIDERLRIAATLTPGQDDALTPQEWRDELSAQLELVRDPTASVRRIGLLRVAAIALAGLGALLRQEGGLDGVTVQTGAADCRPSDTEG